MSIENNVAWVFNTIAKGWSRFGWSSDLASLIQARDKYGVVRLIGGGYNGVVYQLEAGLSDDGSDIETVLITRADDFENPGLVKRLAEIHVYSKVNQATTYTIESRNDFKESGALWSNSASPPGDASGPAGGGTGGTSSGDTSTTAAITEGNAALNPQPGGSSEVVNPAGPTTGDPITRTETATATYASVAAHTTEAAIFAGTRFLVDGCYVRRLNPLTHAQVWNTRVNTTNDEGFWIKDVHYEPVSNTVWARNVNTADNAWLYILNATTGAIISSIDLDAESDWKTNQKGTSSNAKYVFLKGDRDATNDQVQVRLISDRSLVANVNQQIEETSFIVGDNLYTIQPSFIEALVADTTLSFVAKTDHGNIDSSGFTVGTAASNMKVLAYDKEKDRLYSYNNAGEWYIARPAVLIHAADSHKYLPSNTTPGPDIGAFDVARRLVFHESRRQVYACFRRTSDSAEVLLSITPGVGTSTPVLVTTTVLGVLGAGYEVQNAVYASESGVVVLQTNGGFLITVA